MESQIVYIGPSIIFSKSNSNKLITFLSTICNTVSFSIHLNYSKFTLKDYENALSDYYNYYKKEDEKRRVQFTLDEEYRSSLIKKYSSIDEVYKYFDRLRDYDHVQFTELKEELKKGMTKTQPINAVFESILSDKSDISIYDTNFINSQYTLGTHCTIGGLYKEYRYILDKNMITILGRESFFSSYTFNREDRLEDPGFYDDDRLICSICSHERTTTLFLKSEEYKEFCSLEIEHSL